MVKVREFGLFEISDSVSHFPPFFKTVEKEMLWNKGVKTRFETYELINHSLGRMLDFFAKYL